MCIMGAETRYCTLARKGRFAMNRSAKKPVLAVMAAGMGSRYGGLKQIESVGPTGAAILDYSLYDARRAGFQTVIFIISHAMEAPFKATVGARAAHSGMEIRYAYQQLDFLPPGFSVPKGRQKPWGTAHALYCAQSAIDGAPFAVINADDYYGPRGFQLLYDHLCTETDKTWAMVGFLLGNTVSAHGYVSRGVCETDEKQHLVSIVERTHIEAGEKGIRYTEDNGSTWHRLAPDTLVSMNLWGLRSDFLQEAEAGFADFLQKGLAEDPLGCEYYLPGVVTAALRAGKTVRVIPSPDKWHGITYREDKPELEAALSSLHASGVYPPDTLF